MLLIKQSSNVECSARVKFEPERGSDQETDWFQPEVPGSYGGIKMIPHFNLPVVIS